VPTSELPSAGTVALAACAVALLALLVALACLLRLRTVRHALAALGAGAGDRAEGGGAGADLVSTLARLRDEAAASRRAADAALAEARRAREDVGDALRHVSVVRYDAFGDMGGRLSFSAALLDDDGDGVVLTSINGRSETRTYAKGVKGGRSEHPLSPEEEQAVQHAHRGARA
jgi:Protein of unknown function (DUF4446)